MQSEPHCIALRVGPLDPMPQVGRQGEKIPGLQMDQFRLPFYPQPGGALEQKDPLGAVLIVPLVFRCCVTAGKDALQTKGTGLQQCLE